MAGASGRLGVDVLAGPRQDIVEMILPVVHISIVNGARLDRRRSLDRSLDGSLDGSSIRGRIGGNDGLSRRRHFYIVGVGYRSQKRFIKEVKE